MSDPDPKAGKAEAKARRKLQRALGAKLPRTLHCSFCGKSQHEVEKLVAGPRVFICNVCVGLCNDVIAGKPIPDHSGFKPLEQPSEQLLSLLGSVHFAADSNREFLQSLVDTLRSREVSWSVIAEQLGVSRQSAWERFS